MRRHALVAVGLILLLTVEVPMAQSKSALTLNCTATAFASADQLSGEISGFNPQPLANSTRYSQIAARVNNVTSYVNRVFGTSIPKIDIANVSRTGLAALIVPYDGFVKAFEDINQHYPNTTCTFLVATFTVGADVTVTVAGNDSEFTGTTTFLEEIDAYCNASCMVAVGGNITDFVAESNPSLLGSWNTVWDSVVQVRCLLSDCSSQTGTGCQSSSCYSQYNWVPEFPLQPAFALATATVVIAAYILVRRSQIGRVLRSVYPHSLGLHSRFSIESGVGSLVDTLEGYVPAQ